MSKRALFILAIFALALRALGQPQRPAAPPEAEPKGGLHPGLGMTPEQYVVYKLNGMLELYVVKTGKVAETWEDLEKTFGSKVWDSPEQWNNIKRRYAFVATKGRLEEGADGPIDGTLLLAPLYSIREPRSEEEGRYTLWSLGNGQIFSRWNTESELVTFSKWDQVAAKVEAAKAALAQMPPSVIKSTPIPTSTPAPSSPIPTVAETPAPAVERQAPVWPWVIGIAALTVIALVAWKRRA